MNLADRTLVSITQLLDSAGWHGDRIGHAILIHPLGVTLTADVHAEAAEGDVRCVVITATHQLFPQGIQEHAVGLGKSDEEIAGGAAEAWCDHAFAAIHSFLCGGQDSGAQIMDLVTHDTQSDSVFAWKVHMSAPTNYAMDGVTTGAVDHLEFMKELLGPLSEVLLDRKVHTVKCFLGVLPNRSVHSESRFDGAVWEAGTGKLDKCASRWLDEGHYEIRKQFMLFGPCQLSDLKNGDALAAQARAEGVRPMRS